MVQEKENKGKSSNMVWDHTKRKHWEIERKKEIIYQDNYTPIHQYIAFFNDLIKKKENNTEFISEIYS